jgi:hypothetical protein
MAILKIGEGLPGVDERFAKIYGVMERMPEVITFFIRRQT